MGAATNLDDSADNWLEYARLQLLAANNDQNNAPSLRDAAFRATINAYLRADNVAQQHNILVMMGQALEAVQRGRDTVQALRLAQDLQPRDDTAAALDDAMGKYGFRIVDNQVQTDTDRPRICASFSEDLVKSGVDYSTFVQLPEPGMSVSSDGLSPAVRRGGRTRRPLYRDLPRGVCPPPMARRWPNRCRSPPISRIAAPPCALPGAAMSCRARARLPFRW